MPSDLPTGSLEDDVKRLAQPLGELLGTLHGDVRPMKRSPYESHDNWDDEFGKWQDENPPPWMGEERVGD